MPRRSGLVLEPCPQVSLPTPKKTRPGNRGAVTIHQGRFAGYSAVGISNRTRYWIRCPGQSRQDRLRCELSLRSGHRSDDAPGIWKRTTWCSTRQSCGPAGPSGSK